jgi:FkbM family methyltransferase
MGTTDPVMANITAIQFSDEESNVGLLKRSLRAARPLVERIPSLAAFYRLIRDNRLHAGEPQMTPMGFKFIGNPEMERGEFERHERQLVEHLLSVTDVVINVGANIGYYCCIGSQHGKRVVAFEPMPANLYHLYRNIQANGWEQQIEVFPLALADRVGLVEIFGGGTGASLIRGWADTPESRVTTVPVSSLDHVLGHRFKDQQCLLIVDIEGAESAMLRGASSYLGREPKPIWVVEISITEHQPQGVPLNPQLMETFRCFWNQGYRSYAIGPQLRSVEETDIETIVATGDNHLGGHSFLFLGVSSHLDDDLPEKLSDPTP